MTRQCPADRSIARPTIESSRARRATASAAVCMYSTGVWPPPGLRLFGNPIASRSLRTEFALLSSSLFWLAARLRPWE